MIGRLGPTLVRISPGQKSTDSARVMEQSSGSTSIILDCKESCRMQTGDTAGLAKSLKTLLGFMALLCLTLAVSPDRNILSNHRTSARRVRQIAFSSCSVGRSWVSWAGAKAARWEHWDHHLAKPENPDARRAALHSLVACTCCAVVQGCLVYNLPRDWRRLN